jgi:hypothetical protein
MPRNLAALSRDEREEHLKIVRQECIEFRETKRDMWLKIHRVMRGIHDRNSPYRSKLMSTYLWSAIQSWMSVLEPLFFSTFPVFDLTTPRDEDDERNRVYEALLTHQVQAQPDFRAAWSSVLMESLVFGSSYPWTYWRTVNKKIGPFREPVLDTFGTPLIDPASGDFAVSESFENLRITHSPWLEHVDLWDSFIHPDGRRGFSRREVTGYELLQSSGGENPLYEPRRVERMLRAAARSVQAKNPMATTGGMNFHFGDDDQIVEDELALEAGTEAGRRLHEWVAGIEKDVLAMKFPILHYDDGDFSGTYALNVDKRLYELRFNEGASADGMPNRMAITPYSSPQEVFGVSVAETTFGLLHAHTRFLQLAIDGASLTVHPTWMVSEQFDQLVGEIFTGPGAINKVPTTGGEPMDNHLQRMDMPNSWVNAMQFRDSLRDELDQAWAQNEAVQGRFAGGRKTAQEVSSVLQFSQSRLELLADRIGHQFGSPLGKKWLCMNTVHMDREDMMDVVGLKAANIELLDLREVIKQAQTVFKGSVLASNSSSKLQQFQTLAQVYFNSLPMLHLPHVQEFMMRWFEIAGLEAVTKKFPAPQPGMTAFDVMAMQAQSGSTPASPTGGGLPKTPTDVSGMASAAGGATAPPGPSMGV